MYGMTSDEQRPPRRAWLTLGHFSNHISAVASLTAAAYVLVSTATDTARDVLIGLALAVYAVCFVSVAAERTHRRSLCPREISEAPVLDPQAAVDRHARTLRVWHSWWHVVPSVVGLVYISIYVSAPNTVRTWVFAVGFGATAIMSAYLTYVEVTHRRLYPWCPHCRHGGRGPRGFHVPTPDDPTTVEPKPRPVTT